MFCTHTHTHHTHSLEDSGFSACYWKGQACPWVPHVGTGRSEENRGWQDPTFHCPSFHYGDKSPARFSSTLPGPAHTLTYLCAKCRIGCVETVLLCTREKKRARTFISIVRLCVPYCMHARVSALCREQLVPGGGQPSSTGTQTCMFVCEKQNKAVRSLLKLHAGLAIERKNVCAVLTHHMHTLDICTATEADISLGCVAAFSLLLYSAYTVTAERTASYNLAPHLHKQSSKEHQGGEVQGWRMGVPAASNPGIHI